MSKNTKKVTIYAVVGITAFLGEYLSFYMIWSGTGDVIISQIISFLVGLTISFFGSRNLTFRENKSRGYRHAGRAQLVRFGTLSLVNLGITSLGMMIMVDGLLLNPYLSKILIMGSLVVWNYAIFNRIIFTTSK